MNDINPAAHHSNPHGNLHTTITTMKNLNAMSTALRACEQQLINRKLKQHNILTSGTATEPKLTGSIFATRIGKSPPAKLN
jgi:lactam utilization protein B